MLVYFDDANDFNNDLNCLLANLETFNKPLVVLPTEKDVRIATKNHSEDGMSHVTFISYDYWLSKKWLADGEYDHIDYFRVDQFLMSRAYGITVGAATVRRTRKKKDEKEEV